VSGDPAAGALTRPDDRCVGSGDDRGGVEAVTGAVLALPAARTAPHPRADVVVEGVVEALDADGAAPADLPCRSGRLAMLREELDGDVLEAERVTLPRKDGASRGYAGEEVEVGAGVRPAGDRLRGPR